MFIDRYHFQMKAIRREKISTVLPFHIKSRIPCRHAGYKESSRVKACKSCKTVKGLLHLILN